LALWDERLPGESLKAWTAFTTYRDLLADRTMAAAWRKLKRRKRGDAPGRWNAWSSQFRWQERVGAYDVHLDGQLREAREKRMIDLAIRRAEYEFTVQDNLEELTGWLRSAIEKHNAAPITDIERIEGKEVTVGASGEIKVVNVRTRVKGLKTSGLARLADSYRDTMTQAVVGVRGKTQDAQAAKPAKAIMPDFMLDFIEREREEHEALKAQDKADKKETTDGSNSPVDTTY
jgi:hypothetical protein